MPRFQRKEANAKWYSMMTDHTLTFFPISLWFSALLASFRVWYFSHASALDLVTPAIGEKWLTSASCALHMRGKHKKHGPKRRLLTPNVLPNKKEKKKIRAREVISSTDESQSSPPRTNSRNRKNKPEWQDTINSPHRLVGDFSDPDFLWY